MIRFLKTNKIYLIYIPLAVYWLILFIATSLPADKIPTVGVGDKFSHLFAYLVLSFLLYFTLKLQEKFEPVKKYPELFTILLATFYGIFDELHQMLIPGRSAEFLDWIADVAGAIIGTFLAKFVFVRVLSKK